MKPLIERLRAWYEAERLDAVKETIDELERLQAENAALRSTIEAAAHALEKQRIWNGMAWHYNPLPPMDYRPALEWMRKALSTKDTP